MGCLVWHPRRLSGRHRQSVRCGHDSQERGGISSGGASQLGGYSIINAESLAEAAAEADGRPVPTRDVAKAAVSR